MGQCACMRVGYMCVCIDLYMLCTRLYAWCMNFIFCDDGDGNGYIKPIIYFARALSQTYETKENIIRIYANTNTP